MKKQRLSALPPLLLLLLSFAPALAEPTREARLAELVERLEAKRVEHHVPGMSLVVVDDGEVILARGFGVTDLETEDPVTADTLFMVGSTTKAFTATLVGMMVDAGKMSWDEPIATYLPYFDPSVDSDDDSARVTVRDALSHRSGFSRMAMLLTAQDMPPREVLEVANRAEPFDRFRRAFHYNNIMYLAAGTAAAETAGTDYHKLLAKRIFKPLGMKHSYSSKSAKAKGNLHAGYAWEQDLERHKPQPILPIDIAGPAGSIVSNADDMGRWLRFLLAGGEFGGKRLIERATLEETWKQNIGIADGIGYGMGWMLRDWNGRDYVEHGGNIHGFSAQVGLFPEERLGFALMTNLTATALQQESLGIVWDTLLGSPGPDGAAAEGDDENLGVYTGEYIANFGPFQDATFTVTEKNGALYVDVPGQTNYELKPPNEEGLRPFAITDAITVNFERSEDGSVDMMRMRQGGLDFEIPRRGVEFPVEIDPALFAPYLGKYASKTFGGEVSVVISNERLAVDVPDRMVFELHAPDDDGRRRARIRDAMSVTFEESEDGSIASMTLRNGDEVVEVLERTADADDTPLPTLDELLAPRATPERLAAAETLGAMKIGGTVRFVNAGVEGSVKQIVDGDRVRLEMDFGRFGWVHTVLDQDHGEMESHVTPVDEIEGRRLRAMRQNMIELQSPDWREDFEKVRVLKFAELDGEPVVLVRVENPDTPGMTLYVDPVTGDVLRLDSAMPVPGAGIELPITMRFEDFREVSGLRLPFRTIAENQESGLTRIQLETFEPGAESCDALFTLSGEGTCGE